MGIRRNRASSVLEVTRLAGIQGLKSTGGKVGWGKLMVNFPTADDYLDEVNNVVSALLPLPLPQVAAALKQGFVQLFATYTDAMASAFIKYKEADGRLPSSLGARPPPKKPAVVARGARNSELHTYSRSAVQPCMCSTKPQI